MITQRFFRTVAMCCLTLTASAVRAQISLPAPTPAGISVTGHAELKVKPDIAYVSLSVVTHARRRTDAVRANADHTQHVLAILSKAGIANQDIETQAFMVEPQNDDAHHPAVVTSYEITNRLFVTIHDVSKAGVVVDNAVQAGANEVDSVNYGLADREKAEAEAFDAAIAAAHRKAERFALDTGVTVGPLVAVSDSVSPFDKPQLRGEPAGVALFERAVSPITPLVTQRIIVTADVSVVYEIAKN